MHEQPSGPAHRRCPGFGNQRATLNLRTPVSRWCRRAAGEAAKPAPARSLPTWTCPPPPAAAAVRGRAAARTRSCGRVAALCLLSRAGPGLRPRLKPALLQLDLPPAGTWCCLSTAPARAADPARARRDAARLPPVHLDPAARVGLAAEYGRRLGWLPPGAPPCARRRGGSVREQARAVRRHEPLVTGPSRPCRAGLPPEMPTRGVTSSIPAELCTTASRAGAPRSAARALRDVTRARAWGEGPAQIARCSRRPHGASAGMAAEWEGNLAAEGSRKRRHPSKRPARALEGGGEGAEPSESPQRLAENRLTGFHPVDSLPPNALPTTVDLSGGRGGRDDKADMSIIRSRATGLTRRTCRDRGPLLNAWLARSRTATHRDPRFVLSGEDRKSRIGPQSRTGEASRSPRKVRLKVSKIKDMCAELGCGRLGGPIHERRQREGGRSMCSRPPSRVARAASAASPRSSTSLSSWTPPSPRRRRSARRVQHLLRAGHLLRGDDPTR